MICFWNFIIRFCLFWNSNKRSHRISSLKWFPLSMTMYSRLQVGWTEWATLHLSPSPLTLSTLAKCTRSFRTVYVKMNSTGWKVHTLNPTRIMRKLRGTSCSPRGQSQHPGSSDMGGRQQLNRRKTSPQAGADRTLECAKLRASPFPVQSGQRERQDGQPSRYQRGDSGRDMDSKASNAYSKSTSHYS